LRFDLVLPDRIAADWERLGAILGPAVAVDGERTLDGVLEGLLDGTFALFEGREGAICGLVVVMFEEGACWLLYAVGRIEKPRLVNARALVAGFEELARRNGCSEMRLKGRDWSRVLPDYERAGEGNELMKRL
jgi:hypothetical protein